MMARPSKEERLQKVHAEARSQFERVWTSSKDTRLQCQEDRRFAGVPGGQWEGRLGEQFENRPKPEINKVQIALMRIYAEYRNNRISADFVPKDGSTDQDLADVCDGLYRADEQDSCAEESYDNAFDEGVTGGIGAWRLRSDYENPDDDEDERQRIRFEPIFDADSSVFFDTDARRYDKSDAEACWVVYTQEREAYVAEWGDDPQTWPASSEYQEFDWCTPDLVYLCEYYRVERKPHRVHTFAGPDGQEVKYTDDELMEAAEVEGEQENVESAIGVMTLRGFVKLREKRVKKRRVHKYIMSGGKVLEDCGYIAGPNIPIVVFYGKRWMIDGVERCQGHVRLAKDAQRIKNMMYAKLMELNAESSTEKDIMTPEQVAGHQLMWAEDNIKRYPYLLINPVTDASGNKVPQGPVGKKTPPQVPQSLAALMQQSEVDMMDILGRPQDGQEVISNMSGKAVELIQQRLDMQAFLYMSNFAKAMRRSGEIWLGMAKEVYVEPERKMKMLGEMMNIESVTLAQPVFGEGGELTTRNDLTRADFDVTVDVGPSFASKRDATVRALTGVLQMVTDPADAKILQAVILTNMEGEGLSDVNEYYRKQLVGMGVLQPNEQEREQMEAAAQQEQQPDPQAVFLESEAEKNLAQAELDRAKALQIAAQVDKHVAEVDNIDADTAKKEAETLDILRGEPPAPL
jgi:hypothetical protein